MESISLGSMTGALPWLVEYVNIISLFAAPLISLCFYTVIHSHQSRQPHQNYLKMVMILCGSSRDTLESWPSISKSFSLFVFLQKISLFYISQWGSYYNRIFRTDTLFVISTLVISASIIKFLVSYHQNTHCFLHQ